MERSVSVNFSNGAPTTEHNSDKPSISPIVLRTLTGACHVQNRGAIDWSSSGFIAYGSNFLVNVLDPVTVQTVQCLDKHRSPVINVKWANPEKYSSALTLASSDVTGHIIVWNVKSGEVTNILQDGSKPIQEFVWLGSSIDKTSHMIVALHPPFSLILWDTSTGNQIWKKSYTETLQGFDFDPFDISRIAFRCLDCILFIEDFNVAKAPKDNGKKFYVMGPKTSPNKNGNDFEEKSRAARTRIKRMMKDFVMGEATRSEHVQDPVALSECQQVIHHRTARSHLFLVYPREVLVLDIDLGQTVGVIALDRSGPALLQMSSCRLRDVVFLLSENGSVSMRMRRRLYTVAQTPMDRDRLSRSGSVTSTPMLDSVSDSFNMEPMLEVTYEQRASSESIRLSKNSKVLGMVVNPATEKDLAIFTSDGRILLVDVRLAVGTSTTQEKIEVQKPIMALDDFVPSVFQGLDLPSLKLHTNGILSGVAPPPLVIRMCPPLTMKNWHDYKPLMAGGATSGNIQMYNMSTGEVEREFAVHTFPVRGIEWTGLHSVLSHAHQNLSGGSNLVRNELFHTDIRTGKSVPLRSHRSEEPPIEMIRVSHLKQYFIVAFVGSPFELWDLKNLNLLRTMPRKFPPITALEWSPLHNLKSLRKKMNAIDEKEQTPNPEMSTKDEPSNQQHLVVKEHFVFTDPEGQLYHFSVEGNAIRDGTKVPAEGGLGTITCIAWKSDHIVRGDAEGNINVWDVKTRTSKNISTNRGAIRRLRFAPGRGNMKLLVLHADSVAIWDVKEYEMINELRTPKDMVKVADIDWAASDRAVLATIDGCLRVMGLALANAKSPMPDYPRKTGVACHAMLPKEAMNNFEIMLHHQPWKEEFKLEFSKDDGFSESELQIINSNLDLMDPDVKDYLSNPSLKTHLRCLAASQMCGRSWETDFWRVFRSVSGTPGLDNHPLETSFDLVCDGPSYQRYQTERLHLHQTKSANGDQKHRIIDLMLCLGQVDEAIRMLLETEPADPMYYQDNLRACLVASTSLVNTGTPHSTTKLVATNLIAEGRIWEGVQLLCLIGKVVDACNYLQSDGQWDASFWLAKCRLDGEEFVKVATKYCDHCIAKNNRHRAVLIYLSLKDYVMVLELLHDFKWSTLAAQFLDACLQLNALPDTSHALVMTEEVSLTYARHLFNQGNTRAAFHYCEKADEKGEVLQKELEMTLAKAAEKNNDHEE